MRKIQAYQCSDGSIHENEGSAKAHDDDLLGKELDKLLNMFEFGGVLTSTDQYLGILRLMKKREELHAQIAEILQILDHSKYFD